MTLNAFISKFTDPKKSGTNWIAKCPAHNDQNPSLSISEGDGGRILLKCHAGCTFDAIAKALEIPQSELIGDDKARQRKPRATLTKTYSYTDEQGTELFQKCRFEPKRFSQRRKDPDHPNKWIWSTNGVRRPLFRLPEIIQAVAEGRPIYVVEGEKDVEALVSVNLDATTNPDGAGPGKWTKDHTQTLAGANVIIIADKDKPGRTHAQSVASALYGHASSIRVIELPDKNEISVKDSADFLNAGGTVEAILSVCESTKPWEPTAQSSKNKLDGKPQGEKSDAPLYYDSRAKAWWTQNDRGIYIGVNETHVERRLKAKGLSNSNHQVEISEVASAILDLQLSNDVDYAGPLAGWNSGLHYVNNSRILVTESALPTVATPVPFSTLLQVIIGILGEEQTTWLFSWLKVRRMAVLRQEWRPGQAVFFAGPPGCGKSFLQSLITQIVGGRSVKPWLAMSGQTDFNGELFAGEHLCIEDELPDHRMQTRQKLGASIKSYLFAKTVLCHAKNRQGISLEPRWTMTVSLNDEPENLQIIPPLDESIRDKVTLLKCEKKPRPVPEGQDEKEWLTAIAEDELPGLAYHVDHIEIPQKWHEPRTLVRSYHHPEILSELEVSSPELQLFELIQRVYFGPASELPFITVSAMELEAKLREEFPGMAATLFRSQTACPTYLSRLAQRHPNLVERKRQSACNKWSILRA